LHGVAEIIRGLYAGPGCVDLGEHSINVDVVVSLDPSCPVTGGGRHYVFPVENLGIEVLELIRESRDLGEYVGWMYTGGY